MAPEAFSDALPSLSRRHAAGSPSARGLLFTVLGEFALNDPNPVWTATFIEILGRLGVEEKASRQALMRTTTDGWLTAERVGRRTRWRLTSAGRDLLTRGGDRIYSFARRSFTWDGNWLIVLAHVAENDRRTRHLLRTRMSWAGLGFISPGVWLTTHQERRSEVVQILQDAAIVDAAHIFVSARLDLGEPRELVQEAWDLGEIEQSYEEFIDEFEHPATTDPLIRQINLVHAWRRFPSIDPLLPAELLPARWSGLNAARLFARLHTSWGPKAQAAWLELNESMS